jgi:hypothetical protein
MYIHISCIYIRTTYAGREYECGEQRLLYVVHSTLVVSSVMGMGTLIGLDVRKITWFACSTPPRPPFPLYIVSSL